MVKLRRIVIIVSTFIFFLIMGGLLTTAHQKDPARPRATLYDHTTYKKPIALTFDDGPDVRYTPQVLRILKKEHVPATFFVVGNEVDAHPDLARQIVADGNLIENHTYTHPNLRYDSPKDIQRELSLCAEAIKHATGMQPIYFRPPRGIFDNRTLAIAEKDNYDVLLWSIAVEHKASRTPADEARRILHYTTPGSILLAHDGRLNREKTVKALPMIIHGLKARGYTFVDATYFDYHPHAPFRPEFQRIHDP
ncbi:MAG TPA: polysaccharide deacetylase family protein [Candidatus Aquicultor sp.]|jgi:peptidoglycan/xylan/chitin deacetylase (PgdA/CDA1 family)